MVYADTELCGRSCVNDRYCYERFTNLQLYGSLVAEENIRQVLPPTISLDSINALPMYYTQQTRIVLSNTSKMPITACNTIALL